MVKQDDKMVRQDDRGGRQDDRGGRQDDRGTAGRQDRHVVVTNRTKAEILPAAG